MECYKQLSCGKNLFYNLQGQFSGFHSYCQFKFLKTVTVFYVV